MTQDPNMMYVSLYGPYHVHTCYIHLYALRGYRGIYMYIYMCIQHVYVYVYVHVHMCTSYNIMS